MKTKESESKNLSDSFLFREEKIKKRRKKMRKLLIGTFLFFISLFAFAPVYAQEIEQEVEEVVVQEVSNISGADTAFIIICAALVMIMTPGVALFYGGMV